MHNDRWTTTTEVQSNNNNTKNKKINLDTFPVQFSTARLRRQLTVIHILLRCTPLEEASSDEEQYYIRSAWHLQSDVRSAWHLQSDVRSTWHLQSDIPKSDVPTPQWRLLVAKSSTMSGHLHIWWCFGSGWCSVRCTPLVEASGGQD